MRRQTVHGKEIPLAWLKTLRFCLENYTANSVMGKPGQSRRQAKFGGKGEK
jgi:hypothetical protein